jgi:hypothetical protein
LLTAAQQQRELVTLGGGQRRGAGGQIGDVGIQIVIVACMRSDIGVIGVLVALT